MFYKVQNVVISLFIKAKKGRKGIVDYWGDLSDINLDIKDGKESETETENKERLPEVDLRMFLVRRG